MSVVPTGITPEIFTYLNSLSSTETSITDELLISARREDIPDIHISSDEARFLQFFIRSASIKSVLEIGLLGGYSAITMAKALPSDGKLTSIELVIKHSEFAQRFIEKAGLADKITVLTGDAGQILKEIQPEIFDFIFIDADKESYEKYYEICLTKFVKSGTVIGFDNALAFGKIADKSEHDSEILAIRNLNKTIFEDQRVECTLIPVGDGLLLARVK